MLPPEHWRSHEPAQEFLAVMLLYFEKKEKMKFRKKIYYVVDLFISKIKSTNYFSFCKMHSIAVPSL